jgi:hypothetical protein
MIGKKTEYTKPYGKNRVAGSLEGIDLKLKGRRDGRGRYTAVSVGGHCDRKQDRERKEGQKGLEVILI